MKSLVSHIPCNIYRRKSIGDRTEPWGRPCLIILHLLCVLLNFTLACLFTKKCLIHFTSPGGIPCLSIDRSSFSLQTISYALLKSSRTRTDRFMGLLWNPSWICWMTLVIWSSQPRSFLNPAWCGLKILTCLSPHNDIVFRQPSSLAVCWRRKLDWLVCMMLDHLHFSLPSVVVSL